MTSPLLEALSTLKPRGCPVGVVIETSLTAEEQAAFMQALDAKVAPVTVLAGILTDATGTNVAPRQLRAHRAKECSCE